MAEQVSYFHESVSYVRGKYASPEICGSGMLLSKSCHDIDIMTWLMGGNDPVSVSSIGSVFQFKPEMAPEGAGTHCLLDCPVERTCPYSAKRLYIEHPQRWTGNIWHDIGRENSTEEERVAMLSNPENPFSRGAYRCDLKIVDHQSLLVSFRIGLPVNWHSHTIALRISLSFHSQDVTNHGRWMRVKFMEAERSIAT